MSDNRNNPPNKLLQETSPYLLQHAFNPVNWEPWSPAAFERAEKEGKLVLISIGYSACHWCHVMERESFEDAAIASIMNEGFICVKVDREERPDVDHLYMQAVQLMTGQGGWPLNCFALPDGRPVYGGTYFRPDQWRGVLLNLMEVYTKEREKVLEYAVKLHEGLKRFESTSTPENVGEVSLEELDFVLNEWLETIDVEEGGPNRAPKFPMPVNLNFLLSAGTFRQQKHVLKHVQHTLLKMARGGIFDQVGGGFARYSVDPLWKVPHFEKMLYDNAQLMEVYAIACKYFQGKEYKWVVEKIAGFMQAELKSTNGLLYSALDADSEGEEGKYYVWTLAELKEVLGDLYNWAEKMYCLNAKGYWEHERFILLRDKEIEQLAQSVGVPFTEFYEKWSLVNATLINRRNTRVRPGLDDKCLTSWNAMAVSAYCKAYLSIGAESYKNSAQELFEAIFTLQFQEDQLYRNFCKGKRSIEAFLDDYAFLIKACIECYKISFREAYLEKAEQLTRIVIQQFMAPEKDRFYFTSANKQELIARKVELYDNVIPASNSVMAYNLWCLGRLLDIPEWVHISDNLLNAIKHLFIGSAQNFGQYGQLFVTKISGVKEVVITGPEALVWGKQINEQLRADILVMAAEKESKLPLFLNRFTENQTLAYVCTDKVCKAPVASVHDLLNLLNA